MISCLASSSDWMALFSLLSTKTRSCSFSNRRRTFFMLSQPTPWPSRTLCTTSFRNCWFSLNHNNTVSVTFSRSDNTRYGPYLYHYEIKMTICFNLSCCKTEVAHLKEFITLCCWLGPEERAILSSLLDCAWLLKTSGPQVLEVHVRLEEEPKQSGFWKTQPSKIIKITKTKAANY